MKSPLLISAHVSHFPPTITSRTYIDFPLSGDLVLQLPTLSRKNLEILTNREIIAINQDPVVGTGVTPFRWGITASVLFLPPMC